MGRVLSPTEKLDWLRLIRSENVGPVTFHRLLRQYGSAGAALDALPRLARAGGRRREIRIAARAEAEREMAWHEAEGAHLIAWGEPDYPPLLAHVEDAPPLISVLGHPELLGKAAIALVGARNASAVGRRFARELAGELGRAGMMVVSGMARGIDASAHEGALDLGTVAVLGGGVDVIYPRENGALYEALSERGAVLSETPPGTEPQARHFPRRNRIISGIARGVVVVEATQRSGSLITARMALEQGREVFAVPGSPLDPRARGTNNLIRQGAVLTETAADVLAVFDQRVARRPPAASSLAAPPPEAPATREAAGSDAARKSVIESLGPVPVAVDELLRDGQFSTAVISTVLLELELAGRLERHPGNRVSLLTKS